MDEHNITLGEVYRLCQRIEQKVDKTNGTVTDHETRISVIEDRGNRDTTARTAGVSGLLTSLAQFGYSIWKS